MNGVGKKKIKKKKQVKKQVDSHSHLYPEIACLLVFAFALLMAVSLFLDTAGVFGETFKGICTGLLGNFVYVIPFIIMAFSIHCMIYRQRFKWGYKYGFGCGLLVLSAAISHIITHNPDDNSPVGEKMILFYRQGQEGMGGGFVGGIVAEPIVNMFGFWGAIIVFVTFMIICIMIITQISLIKVLKWLYCFVKKGICIGITYSKNALSKYKELKEQQDSEQTIFSEEVDGSFEQQETAAQQAITVLDHQHENPKLHDHIKEQQKQKPVSIQTTKNKPDAAEQEEIKMMTTINEPIAYTPPPLSLLMKSLQSTGPRNATSQLRNNAVKLAETLKSFGVDAKVLQVSRGPSITRYELQPSIGVKVSKIVNLADDIALNLAASGVRIEAPIPGKAAIGIEVPNDEVMSVYLREVLESEMFTKFPSKLAFSLGKDIAGQPVVADIAKMPHLLIAGATGSGKSVCINTLITSILYKANPNEVKLVLIDPKVVELGIYNGIPHLLIPVVTDPQKAASALNWAVQEMVRRYKLFADNNVRDLKGYNAVVQQNDDIQIVDEHQEIQMPLPEVVIVIDELADLMMVAPNDVENAICRLAQMARAAGMHLVIATQRPSVDVITGVIKANIPSRISFAVSSQVDSRTILDMAGAEKLLGKGDMLFYPVGAAKPFRLQGAFVTDKEVETIVKFIKEHADANYQEEIIEHIEQEKTLGHESVEKDKDELLPQAIEIVVETGQASISMLQRRLKIGYARAARVVDQMESRGIIGGYEGSKPRQVLITKEQYQEMIMHSDK